MTGKTLGTIIAIAVAALAVVIVLVMFLNRPAPKPKPAAPPVVATQTPLPTPAPVAAPFSYASKNADAAVSLKLPPSLVGEPDLHARLYSEGVKDLKTFAEGAASARAEDTGDTQPYERTVKWTTAAETAKLLSLHEETYESAGGAHPNVVLDAALWDKALKKSLQPVSLFKRNTDYGALDDVLCDAVTEAKKTRVGADFVPASPDTWQCPKWNGTTVVLAPSTTPGKIGGLTFLFSPYAIGAYAEGPFEITIPLSAFRKFLAPAYADEFAGAPARVGDTTPKH